MTIKTVLIHNLGNEMYLLLRHQFGNAGYLEGVSRKGIEDLRDDLRAARLLEDYSIVPVKVDEAAFADFCLEQLDAWLTNNKGADLFYYS